MRPQFPMNIVIHNPGQFTQDVFAVTIPGLRELKPNQEVVLSCGTEGLGKYRVLDIWSGTFHHIPAAILEIHHDPLCRTFSGLGVLMQSLNGKEAVAQGAKLTALILQREKANGIVVPSPSVMEHIMGARKK